MKDMRIMIISKNLTGGGAERVATNLAGCLSEYAEVVLVVLNGQNNTYGSIVKTIDLKLPEDKGKVKIFWHLKSYKKVRSIKKRFQPTHCISFMAEPDLANILSKGKEKVIISVRNKRSSSNPTKFHYLKNRWVFNRADAIVSLSKMVKEDLITVFGVDEKIIIPIYNPCYSEMIAKKSKENILTIEEKEFFDTHKGRIVITAGRLNSQKGQWHLIRSFKRVLEAVPDAKLIILGQGVEKEYLQSLIDGLSLNNSIFLYGFKENPYAYISKADVFAFPSVFEGLGNILIECMACRIPIVSADCPYGPKELLAPNEDFNSFVDGIDHAEYGILVPPMEEKKYTAEEPLQPSEKCMADALIEILQDRGLRMKYRHLITERGKDFSPEKITKQWIKVLENL